jgi:acetyl esterase
MNKEQAIGEMMKIRGSYNAFRRESTAANIRHVDTSYGRIRVLEYGFDSQDVKPLYVDTHGGGYCVGFPEMDEEINILIKNTANVKVISIDWPKAPENPYPIGQEATYEVVKHYHDNADTYKIDRNSIGTGGYSSGGNFATAIPMKAKERGHFKIRYQMLCFPGTDIAGDPYDKKGSDKVLSGRFIEAIKHCYILKQEDAEEPYASPRRAPVEFLKGLPPALLLVGDIDPLYHECMEYGENLKKAGVDVETHVFENADHGFIYMGLPEDKKKAVGLIIKFIMKHARP